MIGGHLNCKIRHLFCCLHSMAFEALIKQGIGPRLSEHHIVLLGYWNKGYTHDQGEQLFLVPKSTL